MPFPEGLPRPELCRNVPPRQLAPIPVNDALDNVICADDLADWISAYSAAVVGLTSNNLGAADNGPCLSLSRAETR